MARRGRDERHLVAVRLGVLEVVDTGELVDHAREGWMGRDILDLLPVQPHLTAVLQTFDIARPGHCTQRCSGIKRHALCTFTVVPGVAWVKRSACMACRRVSHAARRASVASRRAASRRACCSIVTIAQPTVWNNARAPALLRTAKLAALVPRPRCPWGALAPTRSRQAACDWVAEDTRGLRPFRAGRDQHPADVYLASFTISSSSTSKTRVAP